MRYITTFDQDSNQETAVGTGAAENKGFDTSPENGITPELTKQDLAKQEQGDAGVEKTKVFIKFL